jgi:hypothetical protein
MSHVESHRLFKLAQMPAILDLPEWEHIKDCHDCGLAFIALVHVAECCFSRLQLEPILVGSWRRKALPM